MAGAAFCAATLHVPKRLGPAPAGAVTVSIEAEDGSKLSGWWLKPAVPNGNCVMVLHGIGDSRVGSVGFAPMFLHEGYRVLTPDSRAHGASEGRFVTYGLLEKYDAIAWADWMRSVGCQKVYALGESLGASILIEAAGVRPAFSAIVAEAPYASLREIAEYRVQRLAGMPNLVAKATVNTAAFYARHIDHLDLMQVSPVKAIAKASTPILLVHGMNDLRTPPSNSEALARANPRNPLWLVPNAGHAAASVAAPEEFRKRVLAWFAEN